LIFLPRKFIRGLPQNFRCVSDIILPLELKYFMNTKTWSTQYKNLTIEVSNAWNWQGDSEEEVTINGEVVLRRAYNVTDVSFSRAAGTTFTIRYGEDEVRVVCGSAWHCFGMACRIEVNGNFVGGNKIVLFAKEPQPNSSDEQN